MSEIVIGRIELGVTNNGTPKALIYAEGTDFNNTSEAIEVIGENEAMYLSTRKVGEKVTITTKGKWYNVSIPEQYIQALNSPNYERCKLLFKRSVSGINKALNGARTSIDFESAKILIEDKIKLYNCVVRFVDETLKNSGVNYSEEVINSLTRDVLFDIAKDYTITGVVEDEEVETKSKAKSKTKKA